MHLAVSLAVFPLVLTAALQCAAVGPYFMRPFMTGLPITFPALSVGMSCVPCKYQPRGTSSSYMNTQCFESIASMDHALSIANSPFLLHSFPFSHQVHGVSILQMRKKKLRELECCV